jgi:hypothetical protein
MADWRLAPRRFLFRLYSLRAGFSVCSSFEIFFGSNFSFFSCLASLCPANRSTGARVDFGLIKAAKFCSISWTLKPAVNYPDRGTTCTASMTGFAGDRETRHVRAEPAWPRFGSGRQVWRTRQSLQRCEWILHLTMPHDGNPPARRSWACRVVGDAVIDVHEFMSSFSQPVILKLLKLLVPRSFKERTLLYSGRE